MYYMLILSCNILLIVLFIEPLDTQDSYDASSPKYRVITDLVNLSQRLQNLYIPTYHEALSPHKTTPMLSNLHEMNKMTLLSHHDIMFSLYPNHSTKDINNLQELHDLTISFNRKAYQLYYQSTHISSLFPTSNESSYHNLPTHEQVLEYENESNFHLLSWSLPILLNYIPLGEIILAVGCAVLEMNKIIIQSSNPMTMSGCVIGLITLLNPLKWTGSLIVSLPDEEPYCNFLGMLHVI